MVISRGSRNHRLRFASWTGTTTGHPTRPARPCRPGAGTPLTFVPGDRMGARAGHAGSALATDGPRGTRRTHLAPRFHKTPWSEPAALPFATPLVASNLGFATPPGVGTLMEQGIPHPQDLMEHDPPMSSWTRARRAAAGLGVLALTTLGYATLAGADPGNDPRVEAAPQTPPPGMARMHELMVTGNPGMQRMHELSLEGNPGMQRMHELMR